MGGNAACIVDAGADLAWAAARAAIGSFAHAGQVCIAVQRLLVHREVYEPFKAIFLETIEQEILAGRPGAGETVIGPMIDAPAAAKVREWVQEARDGGARLWPGTPVRAISSRPWCWRG